MTLEIITNPRDMTITVGPKVFDEPYLWKTPEWSFDIKQEIAPHPEIHSLSPKDRNKFFCEQLGPKFNLRFLAANYHLWLGSRFDTITANMLRLGGNNGWRIYSKHLVIKANRAHHHIRQAEADGLHNLIPAIVVFEKSPHDIREEVGGVTWRKIASNSRTRNMKIMQRASFISDSRDCKGVFVSLLGYPSGCLLGVHDVSEAGIIAARITPKKTRRGYEETVHLVRDTMDMTGLRFNPKWSLSRMKHEHDRAVTAMRSKTYSAAIFCEGWAHSANGFNATLLNSPLQIAVEGGTQHHCVASYWKEASKLRYAVLKVDGAERATIGLRRSGDSWSIDQVYGACNSIVSAKCEAFAHTVARAFSTQSYNHPPTIQGREE